MSRNLDLSCVWRPACSRAPFVAVKEGRDGPPLHGAAAASLLCKHWRRFCFRRLHVTCLGGSLIQLQAVGLGHALQYVVRVNLAATDRVLSNSPWMPVRLAEGPSEDAPLSQLASEAFSRGSESLMAAQIEAIGRVMLICGPGVR